MTTNYTASRFIKDYKFPNLKKQTFTFIVQAGTGGGGGAGSSLLTNAINKSIEYDLDYVTNGVIKRGKFVKFVTRPDILFTAHNLPYTTPTINTPPTAVDNNAINGFAVAGLFGPGNITAPAAGFTIGFNKIGTFWYPPFLGSFLNEESMDRGWNWGYYNGSTAEPLVFPDENSVRRLEEEIFKP